jgi:signal transduction histidine kinase
MKTPMRAVIFGWLIGLATISFVIGVMGNTPPGTVMWIALSLMLAILAIIGYRLTAPHEAPSRPAERPDSLTAVQRTWEHRRSADALLDAVYPALTELVEVDNLAIAEVRRDGPSHPLAISHLWQGGLRASPEAVSPPDGFFRYVVESQQSLYAESVPEVAAEHGIVDPPEARAWLGVPLHVDNRVWGAIATWIDYDHQPGHGFTATDRRLFKALAFQTELALENAQYSLELRNHADRLAELNALSVSMAATLSPNRLLRLIAESAASFAGAGHAAVFTLDRQEEKTVFRLARAWGFSQATVAWMASLPLTEAEQAAVFELEGILVVEDLGTAREILSPAVYQLADREDIAALVYLPLRSSERILGLLAIYYDDVQNVRQSQRMLLKSFANQASLTMVNARIHQQADYQLARRISQIVRMSTIGQKLNATLELEEIFRFVIDSALEGCNANAGVLLLAGDPDEGYAAGGEPRMVAWRGFEALNSVRPPHVVAEELRKSVALHEGEPTIMSTDQPEPGMPASRLHVPVTVSDSVIGVIGLESGDPDAFRHEDVTFVRQLATHASSAIRNAQLYRQASAVRDRLQAILDASRDGVIMLDQEGHVVMANARMADFFEYAGVDSPPDTFQVTPSAVHLDDLAYSLGFEGDRLAALAKRAFMNPGMQAQQESFAMRAGPGQRNRFIERTVTPVYGDQSEFLGLLIVLRDITEEKELEETRANLMDMIVHDLRSPLQAIMGSIRLIMDMADTTDPLIMQATEISQQAAKRLLQLVNNLLDLSLLERGELILDTNAVAVRPLIDEIARELMPLAKEIGTMIQVETADDLLPIEVDEDMIERVVINLLDNALKYAEPGSLVSLTANDGAGIQCPGKDAPFEEGKCVCISVADSGPGIPDDYKRVIFDRYAQVPGQKGRRRSAGLGLAFCRMAVEAHGGAIWVEDREEGGSVFRITLPTTSQDAAKPPPDAA